MENRNYGIELKVNLQHLRFMIFHHNVKVPRSSVDTNDLQHVLLREPFAQSFISPQNTAVTQHLYRERL